MHSRNGCAVTRWYDMIAKRWRQPRRMSTEKPINARSDSILMCASHASLSLYSNRKFCDCIHTVNWMERRRAINVKWRGQYYNLNWIECGVCVCLCIYECSQLIILCARAHLILFLLSTYIEWWPEQKKTTWRALRFLFIFFHFFFGICTLQWMHAKRCFSECWILKI